MNKEIFEGKWHELKGKVKEKWGKLTDDEITRIGGDWEQMVGHLEKKYGYKKDQAENELKNWQSESHKTQRRSL